MVNIPEEKKKIDPRLLKRLRETEKESPDYLVIFSLISEGKGCVEVRRTLVGEIKVSNYGLLLYSMAEGMLLILRNMGITPTDCKEE